jgi:hypothetical protein
MGAVHGCGAWVRCTGAVLVALLSERSRDSMGHSVNGVNALCDRSGGLFFPQARGAPKRHCQSAMGSVRALDLEVPDKVRLTRIVVSTEPRERRLDDGVMV